MLPRDEVRRQLDALGVSRWDTAPPAEGRIRWLDRAGNPRATARYAVILSVGPGPLYTLGHAVSSYAELGIPFVPRLDDGPDLVADLVDEAEAWARAEAIGRAAGADFVYACGSLLVGVFDFEVLPDPAQTPAGAARAALTAAAASWIDLVERGDVGAMDFAREDVTAADIPALAALYAALPRREQRVALVLFAQDHADPAMEGPWRDLVALDPSPADAEGGLALAIAVAGLEGDPTAARTLAADAAELHRRAAALRARR